MIVSADTVREKHWNSGVSNSHDGHSGSLSVSIASFSFPADEAAVAGSCVMTPLEEISDRSMCKSWTAAAGKAGVVAIMSSMMRGSRTWIEVAVNPPLSSLPRRAGYTRNFPFPRFFSLLSRGRRHVKNIAAATAPEVKISDLDVNVE